MTKTSHLLVLIQRSTSGRTGKRLDQGVGRVVETLDGTTRKFFKVRNNLVGLSDRQECWFFGVKMEFQTRHVKRTRVDSENRFDGIKERT